MKKILLTLLLITLPLFGGTRMCDKGEVIKLLKDDLRGIKHQKFIIKIHSGLTLLVAHNIDLAPRIDTLQKGDQIKFCGEFETNSKGGVIHWTHHDPRGKHQGGWIEHKNKRYE